MSYNEALNNFAKSIGLPKSGNTYNWFRLPEDIFMSWFRWEDSKDERRTYLVYDPPFNIVALYNFIYSQDFKRNKTTGLDLNVGAFVHCCTFGCLLGKMYTRLLNAPKYGVFVNLVDLDRFTQLGRAIIEKGERLFYIDYSQSYLKDTIDRDILEKLYKLRELKRRGVGGEQRNAERMFYEMLNKYGIKESELGYF